MNLYSKLQTRADQGQPVRLGIIGAGKFGTMYLAQVLKTRGVHVAAIADLSPSVARSNLLRAGWNDHSFDVNSIEEALKTGRTYICDDPEKIIVHLKIEIIIECTGNPIAAVDHCLMAFSEGKHVINATVEADALCGYMLARHARSYGVVYSLAYGDQPALTCDLVDWARTCGFTVSAAGRGHKWLPHYRASTPDTIWDYWGLTAEQAKIGGLNPKMFNSFLDGSKPAIECAAIANATGLDVPENGLSYPPGSIDDIPTLMRPKSEGGILSRKGMVEVVSSLEPDGTEIDYDIRKGVWVCVEGDTDYLKRCFEEYKVVTDESGRYMCLYKRWHLIGLELGISVASVALRQEPTGIAAGFNADVVATAKCGLSPGDILDGEGGYTVYGALFPATRSIDGAFLPLGLAHNIRVRNPIMADQPLRWEDVAVDETTKAYRTRMQLEDFARKDQTTG